jgi:hypothetical protein
VRLIRYEDFRANKKAEIEVLAKELGFTKLADISWLVDVQFQPKGAQPESVEAFFGQKSRTNLTNCGTFDVRVRI